MKKLLLFFSILFSLTSLTLSAQIDDKHEMSNMRVSINAVDYNSSRFIDKVTEKKKDYIAGKGSAYNKKGEAKKALAPYAEYEIKSKLAGGTYNITRSEERRVGKEG